MQLAQTMDFHELDIEFTIHANPARDHVYPRNLLNRLKFSAEHYPVVLVDGPRQSGKSTLCRGTYPEKPYVSLESVDNREFAHTDRGYRHEDAGLRRRRQPYPQRYGGEVLARRVSAQRLE